MILRRLLPSFLLLMSGCAGAPQGYPSLARRPIEDAPVAKPAIAPAPAEMADPALAADIARLAAQADAGRAAFDRAYPIADKATRAAIGSAVSSDAWVAAQSAISSLEAARNDSVSALASLDVLYIERNNAIADGKARGGAEAIEAARATTLATVDSQNDRVDALKGRLAQP